MTPAFSQEQLLRRLVALEGDIAPVLQSLRPVAQGADLDTIRCARSDIRRAVEAFQSGRLSGVMLERWAEAIHTRDEIFYEPDDEAFLAEAIFQLSTPELFGPIAEVAAQLLHQAEQPRDD